MTSLSLFHMWTRVINVIKSTDGLARQLLCHCILRHIHTYTHICKYVYMYIHIIYIWWWCYILLYSLEEQNFHYMCMYIALLRRGGEVLQQAAGTGAKASCAQYYIYIYIYIYIYNIELVGLNTILSAAHFIEVDHSLRHRCFYRCF